MQGSSYLQKLKRDVTLAAVPAKALEHALRLWKAMNLVRISVNGEKTFGNVRKK